MIYLVQALEAQQTLEEYRRFIGSPEHLRRMAHHVKALSDLRVQRLTSGRAFKMVSVGMGSPSETRTLRNARGRAVFIDGPFAETKEVLAGFTLIEFPTRDDAIEFARNEHVRDVDHTMVVRGVQHLWWGDSIKSGVSANLFMLRIYSGKPSSEISTAEEKKLARHIQHVAAEYAQGRGTIDDNNLSWSVALLEPFTGAARRSAGGKTTSVDLPTSPDGKTEVAFVLVACSSLEEAQGWAGKLALREGDALEVRSVTRYSWLSLD
jgi:hypothetical protein